MDNNTEWQQDFDEKFNHDNPDGVAVVIIDGNGQRPGQHELKSFIQQLLDKQDKQRVAEIKEAVFGELRRSELQAVVDYMERTRGAGHTYSAVEGVKNNPSAALVVVHPQQSQSTVLPKEKTVTLEQLKSGRFLGTRRALVVDNYALFEMARDLLHRYKRLFERVEGSQ